MRDHDHASPARRRCVQAVSSIKEGEVVVEVHDDAVLMAENSGIADKLEGAAAILSTDQDWAMVGF